MSDGRCHGRDVDPDEFGYHQCRRPEGHDGDHICRCDYRWRYTQVSA